MRILFIAYLCLFFVACKFSDKHIDGKRWIYIDKSITGNKQTDSLTKELNNKRYSLIGKWSVIGTEPFWNIYLHNDTVLFTKLNENVDSIYYQITDFLTEGNQLQVNLKDKKDNSANLIIIESNSFCSDGMSDKRYQYSATLTYKDLVLKGCAEKK
ncbi:MAG: hypothetical protein U0U67_12950 [Chitinophagales bacterium]